ncbi:hypothetical protein ABW17_03330 [Mycobacterium nebraskense]|uniref:hypothetical protein n=1 Tax=Mycobacterium nebraskense TaxID=244292 RepID=UPI000641D764|nr:hypothetical protein [Mycobacterium nebraskense]KLO46354.1 hypothetical protein ABW17_03330 [Mycobacterium nebraskense]
MNMVQTTHYNSPEPPHPFGCARPDDLPIAVAAWDVAKKTGKDPRFLVQVLFGAVKQLEAELIALRAG